MTEFRDLADIDEDRRINEIGKAAMTGKAVAFVTDADPGKADRYIAKLASLFPRVMVTGRYDGPVVGTVTVAVTGPQDTYLDNY